MLRGFYLVEFDASEGPIITRKESTIILNDTELTSLKFGAFPESSSTITQTPHIYCYRVSDFFCYCHYTSVKDATFPRGYHQFSYVILTDNSHFPIWYRLLNSISSLKNFSTNAIFDLLVNFSNKCFDNYQVSNKLELPLFNGSTPIFNKPQTKDLITFNSPVFDIDVEYLCNQYFLGDDLCDSLGIKELSAKGKLKDITRLWEMVILEEPILVFGATPAIASKAVFAIASLTLTSPSLPKVNPYICITDPSFINLTKNPYGIIGVSNPIAPSLFKGVPVFYVGFPEKNGFRDRTFFSKSVNVTGEELRAAAAAYTQKLSEIVLNTLSENPFAGMLGKVDMNALQHRVISSGLWTFESTGKFAEKLVHSNFFVQHLHNFLEGEYVATSVKKFNTKALSEEETVTITQQIAKILQKGRGRTLEPVLRGHLRDLFASTRSISVY